jgi:hypothetical protein
MYRRVLSRMAYLRFVLTWVAPTLVEKIWGAVADDYNTVNLAELVTHKDLVAKDPVVLDAVNRAIDFIDPAHGTADEFVALVKEMDRVMGPSGVVIGYLAIQGAIISRSIAGEDSALEAAYSSWRDLQPPEHGARQDFMFRLRIVQVARHTMKRDPLDDLWTRRMETALRDFMCERRGVFHTRVPDHVYRLGSMIPGMMFVAQQYGYGRLPLLKELIDWCATDGHDGMLKWPDTPRQQQADSILLRMLDVIGVEFGISDPLAREMVFFGLDAFLAHAARNHFPWETLGTILNRVTLHAPHEVTQFLADQSEENAAALRAEMLRANPQAGLGSLISQHRNETFVATVMAEPRGRADGLRVQWQEFLRVFLGPATVRHTLRTMVRMALRAMGTP